MRHHAGQTPPGATVGWAGRGTTADTSDGANRDSGRRGGLARARTVAREVGCGRGRRSTPASSCEKRPSEKRDRGRATAGVAAACPVAAEANRRAVRARQRHNDACLRHPLRAFGRPRLPRNKAGSARIMPSLDAGGRRGGGCKPTAVVLVRRGQDRNVSRRGRSVCARDGAVGATRGNDVSRSPPAAHRISLVKPTAGRQQTRHRQAAPPCKEAEGRPYFWATF